MAIYTKLTKQEIEEHLKNYPLGELINFKEIIEGIDNSNFIIDTTQGRFILTIFESRIDKESLPFFINLKIHLAKNGIPCPLPILDKSGNSIVNFKDKKSVIVTFLGGASLKAREDGYYDNITPNHCFEIGQVLAKLHLAVADFEMSRDNELNVKGWGVLFEKLHYIHKNLRAEIADNLELLQKEWHFNLPGAASHLDLFPDNVFFDQEGKLTGVIDFYFAANDAFIYDFAVAANAWCFDERNNFEQLKFDELMRGYEGVRKFLDAEKDFLKIALIGAAMRFLLTRLNDMFSTSEGSLVRIKNPKEYQAKLRFFRSQI